MVSFESDYTKGVHPRLLERLAETNMEPLPGYGQDPYCESARERIRLACGSPKADVFFLVGGTQTNAVVIASLLAPYEGVLAAETGHVNTHEAGAIEYSGHKVLSLPEHEGKICAAELQAYVEAFYEDGNREHEVFPGMVYLSWPTEYGTLYTRSELEEIARICRSNGMRLYLDGARLGYGLVSAAADLTLPDIAGLCDVFYIGGTKVGALCGEAVVFPRGNAPKHFMTVVKQRGALLAKGRLLGVQFDTLFTDNLYLEISRHAIEKAEELKEILRGKGLQFALETPTNQQFIIMEDKFWKSLKQQVAVSFWEKSDERHTVMRWATSWATTEEELEELRQIL